MAKKSSFGDLDDAAREGLAVRIRAMVDAAGSQPAAAKLAQLSVRQIAAYVAGESAPPLLPIARLATSLGFDLNWLISGEGEPHRMTPTAEAMAAIAADAKRATGFMRMSRIAAQIAARLRDVHGAELGLSERVAGAIVALLFTDPREESDEELVDLGTEAFPDIALRPDDDEPVVVELRESAPVRKRRDTKTR